MMQLKQNYPTLIFLFFTLTLGKLMAQCPAPTITIDPMPICSFPVNLKAEGGPYTDYRWNNMEITPQITVAANGVYTVTVTCANSATASATVSLNFTPPSARMASAVLSPCLEGDNVPIQIITNNSIPGSALFTIVSSAMDTIIFENAMTAGTNTITFIGTAPLTYTLLSVVSFGGCNYALAAPKVTQVIPVFQSEEQFPTIGGDPYFCKNGSTQLVVNWVDPEPTAYLWTTPGFPQWTLPFFNVTQEAEYFVYVTYSPNCQILLSQEVEEIQPMPDIVGGPVCSGSPAILSTTETFVSYEWSTGETSPEIEIEESGNYRVTITDIYGCTGIGAQTIQEIPSPNLSINGPIVLCTGQNSAQLVAQASNIATYEWSTGATSPNILITGPGEFTVTVTSNTGCTAESTQIVEAITTPVASLTSPVNICQGNSAILSPTVSVPDVAYLWSNGSTASSITVNTGGVYRVTVSDPTLSCSTSALTLVTILPLPDPTVIASDPEVCTGTTIVLSTNMGAGTGFLWSNGSTASSISTQTAGTYSVTVTAINGCKGSDSLSVTTLPVPNPQIVGPQSLCGRDSVFISTSLFPQISWSTGDTTTGIWVKSAGAYSVVVTNNVGCTASKTINIANTTPGNLAINGGNTLCGSDSLLLVASGPFVNYNWGSGIINDSLVVNTPGTYNVVATDNFGCTATRSSVITNQGGFSTTVALAPLCNGTVSLNGENGFAGYNWSSGATTQNLVANALGNYTVTVTNAAGCTASTSFNVVSLPQAPIPTAIGPAGICPENTGSLAVNGNYAFYSWSDGSNNATAIAPTPGVYTVTVTDEIGCTGTSTVTVGAYASPLPEIAGSQTICNGQPSELSVSSNYSTISWSTGDATPVINVAVAGSYTVTVSNNNGCTSATSIALTASDVLSPNLAIEPYNCDEQLIINAGAGYATYLWSTGDTTTTIAVDTPGEYSLTVTNASGCTGTSNQAIVSIPVTPPLGIEGATVFCDNTSAVLLASANFNTYSWSTGANSNEINITIGGTYTVTATDVNGCTRTAEFASATIPHPEPLVAIAAYDCKGGITLGVDQSFASYSWTGGSTDSTLAVNQVGDYAVTVTDALGCTGENTIAVSLIPQTPEVAIEGPIFICDGAIGTLAASAGFVAYAWSTGDSTAAIDISMAGAYAVTITDANNCTAVAEQAVEVLAVPVPVITPAPYNCDGVITLGTGEFAAYNWSDGSTSDTIVAGVSGVYTVMVIDANGCTGETSLDVIVPVLPDPIIVETPLPNYTSQLVASTGYESYLWSNGDTLAVTIVTVSGIYTVTITDAYGCTATVSQEVVLLTEPLVVASSIEEITCANENDGQIRLCINGGVAPYTPTSTPVVPFVVGPTAECAELVIFNSIPEGNFMWTLTDANGVNFSGSYVFVSPSPLIGSATVAQSTITASATGGVAPYQFSLDGTNYQSSPVFDSLPNGAYQVVVLDARGCTFLTGTLIVFTVDTENPADGWQLQITPNPGNGLFWLSAENLPAADISLTIWDITGKLMQQRVLSTSGSGYFRHPIDLTEAGAGTYMIKVQTENAVKTIPVVVIR